MNKYDGLEFVSFNFLIWEVYLFDFWMWDTEDGHYGFVTIERGGQDER